MAVGIAGSDLGDDSNKRSVGGIAHVFGAGVSLALLIGVSVWGYQLITRDISGVPVVRAAEGPMRVQPDSPGGTVADHQGLSVNEIAAVGTASQPADRLILAPAPLDLSEDDVALASPPVEEPQETPVEQTSTAEAADAPKEELDPVQLAAVEALANALASGVDPINSTPTVPLDDTETAPADAPEGVAALEEAQPIEEDVASAPVEGGLGRSLRPQLRPAGLGGLGALAQSPAIGATDIDPESLPVGTRLAQLGAFASAEIAQAEWEKLTRNFGDYLEGKGRVIQKATSGGRTFYRLRAAGFEDLSDARRFCSALVAERAECIPVITR